MTPKQWKRLFFRIIIWVLLIALAGLLIAVSAATWRVMTRGEAARTAHESAEDNLEGLTERKAKIEEALRKLDTSRGVEEEIRERYQVGLPGEEQFVIVEPKNKQATSSEEAAGIFETIKGWFGF
jgi:cell division protein FtsB